MAQRAKPVEVHVGGHRLRLTNLDKVLYPATGTTKADVLEYYAQIAPVMVPHCTGRPATRKRWPDGVGTADQPGEVFFQKNLGKGARSEEHTSELQSRGQLVCRLLLEINNVITLRTTFSTLH